MIDYQNAFSKISSNVKKTLMDKFPYKGNKYTLNLEDVEIQEYDPDPDIESQIKFNEDSLTVPVKGKMNLVDNETGQVVDSTKKKLMDLPVYTPRGSFIIKGNEYYVSLQNRRRPGVYPVKRDTGEVEAEFNIAKGASKAPTMKFHPEKGYFIMKIGQSNKPLYPILKAIGVTDEELEKRWGKDVLMRNKQSKARSKNTILDAAKRLSGKKFTDVKKAGNAIKQSLSEMQMERGVNKRTIGLDHRTIHPETLIKTSEKMLNINKGKEDPVDRNALHFKTVHHIEDFLPERLNRHAKKIERKTKLRLNKSDGKISKIITSGVFSKPVKDFFTSNSLAELGSQYNPVDMVSSANKITSLGKGGISDIDRVRDEVRALHNSHAGFFDPIQTPESEKIGVNLHLASGATKVGKKLYTNVYDVKKGKYTRVPHTDFADKIIALPGSSWTGKKFKKKTVRAFKDGKVQEVPTSKVNYVLSAPQSAFSVATNLVPFLNSNSGARMFMAAKQYGQSLNLKNREVPLVQAGRKNNSFEKVMATAAMANSPVSGTVTDVNDKYIEVTTKDNKKTKIPLYKDFPLNNKHFLNTEKVLVKRNQKINKGQPLLENNFTKDGRLALGVNLRTAFLADGGYNFEDGITISESVRNKLASEHLYNFQTEMTDKDTTIGAKKYMAQFPGKVKKDQVDKLDDTGVVREGQVLKKGDPLFLALRKSNIKEGNKKLASIGRKLKRPYRDASQYWENDHEGVVKKVVTDKKGNHKIYVKTLEPLEVADKLAGRYGNKGVITRILPDDKMPKNKDGEHMEILLNPTGVPSRMNAGQQLETALARVAKKKGKPIVVESFRGEDKHNTKMVRKMLKANGFDPDGKEELFDSQTGKPLGRVASGYQYILKLNKTAKTGLSGRGGGPGEKYDMDNAPTGGSEGGAKAVDILSIYGMLAHGANNNLREMATDKASNDPTFWRAVKNGQALPPPKSTYAYNKFISYLKGSGVNIQRKGTNLHLTPMTDDTVEEASAGEITNPKFIQAKNLKPIKGGFYDPIRTGGLGGKKWNHISLAEPVVNPMFYLGVRNVLGMTSKEVDENLSKNGGQALREKLDSIDLDGLEKEIREKLSVTNDPNKESRLNKRLHYIKALKGFEMNPSKAYTLSKLPVIPPNMRPVNQIGDNIKVAQINFLYRDALLTNNGLKKLNQIKYMPNSLKAPIRGALQKSVNAVAGINDPLGYYANDNRKPVGFTTQIKGKNRAKEGFFQRKVIRHTQDVSGRGVITPDPKLGVDEIKLPEPLAWKIYEPFIERGLRKRGFKYDKITDQIENKKEFARKILEAEMENRPVLLNRPPTLHKFGFLGFKPKLSNGKTIRIPSLAVKGFNADFDGDAMIVHVPVREEAVNEVKKKMMPSQSLFNPRNDDPVLVPSMEAVVGIHRASKTNEGLQKLKDSVPATMEKYIKPGMTKTDINDLLTRVGKTFPNEYADVAQKIKLIGDKTAYDTGFTVGLDDLVIDNKLIDQVKKETWKKVSQADSVQEKNQILAESTEKITQHLKKHNNNAFVEMMLSGGKGSGSNVRQMIGMPVQYTDKMKAPIPRPNFSNFAQGMTVNDYWTSLHSARRSMIDRKMETADPGAFAKQLLINTANVVAGKPQPLDDDGEEFDVSDYDAFNRYIAKRVKDKDGNVLADKGEVYTPKVASKLKEKGVDKVNVHTVLSSYSPDTVNPKAFGLLAEGKLPQTGDNIGALAGQALAEPLTQGAMKTFHTGGTADAKGLDKGEEKGYAVIKRLIELPQTIPNAATLAKAKGVVASVEPNPVGGFDVIISGKKHYIKPGREPKIKKGDSVDPGQPLSTGFVHPKDLLETTKDMDRTRKYMVEGLKEHYGHSGASVRRRNLEVVVKALTDTARVLNPGNTDSERGDIISYDYIRWHNSRKPKLEDVSDDLEGKVLTKATLGYKPGTVITEEILDTMQAHNVPKVMVKNQKIKYKPILLGASQLQQKTGDLMTNMQFGYIARALKERAAKGEKIPLHGYSPIPAYAYGKEFGKGEGVKY